MKFVVSAKRILFALVASVGLMGHLLAMDVPRSGYRTFSKGSAEEAKYAHVRRQIFQKGGAPLSEIIPYLSQNPEVVLLAAPDDGVTLLIAAAYKGYTVIVDSILKTGIELGLDATTAINQKNKDGDTALSDAALTLNLSVVEYLLQFFNPSQDNIRHAIKVTRQNHPRGEEPTASYIVALLERKLEGTRAKPSAQEEQSKYEPQPEQPKPQERPWQMPEQQTSQQIHPGWPDLRPGATSRQTLGLPNTATVTEAKRAYRKLALIYHPDKFEDNRAILAERGIITKEQATAAFQKISNAWERLNPKCMGTVESE